MTFASLSSRADHGASNDWALAPAKLEFPTHGIHEKSNCI
jgi:hypothetical protein